MANQQVARNGKSPKASLTHPKNGAPAHEPAPAPKPAPKVTAAERETALRALEADADSAYLLIDESRRTERLAELRVRAHQEQELESARADAARARSAVLANLVSRLEGGAS